MGVRLYPIAKQGVSEVEVFNKVAPSYGWSQISAERFEVYKTLEAKLESEEITSEEYFETLYDGSHDDIQMYSSFTLFGFGKFSSHYEAHHDYCGEELNLSRVGHLCYMNDIPCEVLEVIDGFCWG